MVVVEKCVAGHFGQLIGQERALDLIGQLHFLFEHLLLMADVLVVQVFAVQPDLAGDRDQQIQIAVGKLRFPGTRLDQNHRKRAFVFPLEDRHGHRRIDVFL